MVCACWTVAANAKNIDKYGDAKGINSRGAEISVKQIVITKVLTNFFLAFAIVIVVIVGVLKMISQDLFVAYLTVGLAGLGLKITDDWRKDRNTEKLSEK